MQYVPLTSLWATHGLAAVTVAALQDAGFSPIIECDPRGWLHFYGWPLGSQRPITVWIPAPEHNAAVEFLAVPVSTAEDAEPGEATFWSGIHANRNWLYLLWLVNTALGLVPPR